MVEAKFQNQEGMEWEIPVQEKSRCDKSSWYWSHEGNCGPILQQLRYNHSRQNGGTQFGVTFKVCWLWDASKILRLVRFLKWISETMGSVHPATWSSQKFCAQSWIPYKNYRGAALWHGQWSCRRPFQSTGSSQVVKHSMMTDGWVERKGLA